MNFNNTHYVPCLRWKQGEYQAISHLTDAKKRLLTPIIEVPEIGWDFQNAKKAKTLEEHLEPFAKRVHDKWGEFPCFLDMHLISSANLMHHVDFVFAALRKLQCSAIPVIGLAKDLMCQEAIKKIIKKDERGVCLRVSIEQTANNSIENNINDLLKKLDVKINDCDFIIDIGFPTFIPLEGFSKVINILIQRLPHINNWRTFSMLGTSFPESMGGIKPGIKIIPRYEWQIYKIVVNDLKNKKLRLPAFGDYAISHPQILELDMRVVKPSATIRYTIDDNWCIVKGKNVRDYGFEQYRDMCKRLVQSQCYFEANNSFGDDYIKKCAEKKGKTGNLSMWRQVGTNRHIEKVLQDISNFYVS